MLAALKVGSTAPGASREQYPESAFGVPGCGHPRSAFHVASLQADVAQQMILKSAHLAKSPMLPLAVFMQAKRIEEVVARPVFIHDSRSVSLTANGDALIEYGGRLLAMTDETETRFAQNDLAGEVRLGAPQVAAELFLPPMMRLFAGSHPFVAINVVADVLPDMVGMAREGRLDVAIVT